MFLELDEDGSGQARGGDGWESKGPMAAPKATSPSLMSQGLSTISFPRLLNPDFCEGGVYVRWGLVD